MISVPRTRRSSKNDVVGSTVGSKRSRWTETVSQSAPAPSVTDVTLKLIELMSAPFDVVHGLRAAALFAGAR